MEKDDIAFKTKQILSFVFLTLVLQNVPEDILKVI